MKIIQGITKANFGGAQRYVFDLSHELSKQGHQVSVMCGVGNSLVAKLKAEKIPFFEIESLARDISIVDDIKSFLAIYKVLRKERPDVFHINSSKMGGLGALAGRLAGTRSVIFTSHGWAFNESRPLWQKVIIKFFVWITILLSHQTICVSRETKRQVSRLPFVQSKLVVIHNGVGEFTLLPSEPRKIFVVGALGELHHIKGYDILLKAWSKFVKKHGAKLVICGEGEERGSLVKLADELGISKLVEFRGYVPNARSELLNFDIFVMPSRSENLPYSILEAGFAGLPVIASRVGGIPEIIESSVNGDLIPAEDHDALFSALVLYYDNPRMRDRLGAALKETIQKNFTLEKMVSETLKLYSA